VIRDQQVTVSCTATEKAEWQARADAAGIDLSLLVWWALKQAKPDDDKYALIQRIGADRGNRNAGRG